MKRKLILQGGLIVALVLLTAVVASASLDRLSDETKECLGCHDGMPGIVKQWEDSAHWNAGVGCYECHKAENDDVDSMNHNGFSIAIIVSPRDCGQCHPKETAEQEASHHAKAGDILNSKDGILGQTIGGEPAVAVGCRQCHGSLVKVNADGSLDTDTWPNTGIGRVNPDGSKGTCSACHARHRFSKEQARRPETCGKCHLGPDHPQKEVYEESKHGILYRAFEDDLNMDKPKWIVGQDYYDAPTCATCHMSGIGDLETTHNVSQRLYWNLWAKSSKVRNSDDPMDMLTGDGEAGRAEMEQVCGECHTTTHTKNYFASADKAVELYNVEYWEPVEAMRVELAEAGLLKDNPWEDEFMILHYHIWHHDGRRARQGAMMGAPDWAHWHGFFQLQQKLNLATAIYEQRMATGEIETAAPWTLAP
ncbi:MAG: cytochrome c3 family protein [Anaerolineales bacterium]|nr:cytochrome c3 family protein [Anaerolineales bacterium]